MNVKRELIFVAFRSPVPLITIITTITMISICFAMTDSIFNFNFIIDGTRVKVIEKIYFIGPIQETHEISPLRSLEIVYESINEKQVIIHEKTPIEQSNIKSRYSNTPIEPQIAHQPEILIKHTSYRYGMSKLVQNDVYSYIAFMTLTGFMIFIAAWTGVVWPYKRVLSLGNMENRSKQLQKFGIPEFIKKTNAILIHQSSRGNSLYQSYRIIKNRKVFFLVYQDTSTNRMYIKYVPERNPITREFFKDADTAQAWSLSMNLEKYKTMSIEA